MKLSTELFCRFRKLREILLVTAIVLLAACFDDSADKAGTSPGGTGVKLSDADIMTILHCDEMKMPECDKYKGIKLTEQQIKQGCGVMPEMKMCEVLNK